MNIWTPTNTAESALSLPEGTLITSGSVPAEQDVNPQDVTYAATQLIDWAQQRNQEIEVRSQAEMIAKAQSLGIAFSNRVPLRGR